MFRFFVVEEAEPFMSSRASPTPAQFADKFKEHIRVGLNWDRFLAERWPIERVTLNDRESLGRCFMPWYVGKVGEDAAYDDTAAAPMSVKDVPKATEILNEERREGIEEKIDDFLDEQGVIRFTAPSYGLPDGGHFILDRNHRLSALAMSSLPFEVELWNVRGPFEEDCLLDLNHWLRKDDA